MWNYRIIKRQDKNSDNSDYYSLVEMFYNDEGVPCTFADHDEVVGETPEDIRSSLILMLGDADKEIDSDILINEKDFEKGGRYVAAGEKWLDDALDGVKDRIDGKSPKGQSPEEAHTSLDKFFREMEIEQKEDHRVMVREVLKHACIVDIEEDMFNKICEDTYKSYRDGDDEEEGGLTMEDVTPDFRCTCSLPAEVIAKGFGCSMKKIEEENKRLKEEYEEAKRTCPVHGEDVKVEDLPQAPIKTVKKGW